MVYRLRYKGFLALCVTITIYIYISIMQLTLDIYKEDPYLHAERNVIRNSPTNNSFANRSGIVINSTISNIFMHESTTCFQPIEEFSCSNISDIKLIGQIGRGVTKEVFKGVYKERKLAVKMVTSKVADVKKCLQRKKYWKEQDCYLLANYKVLKEILFVQQLRHANILQRMGYCVRNERTSGKVTDHGVVYVTELGEEFKPAKYNRLPWQHRLKTVLELLDLLHYLEHSPIGSLMMTDMKLSQFLVVGNKVKLGDMDDVTNEEQECQKNSECNEKINYGVECVRNRCRGINAKFNLHYFNSKIFSMILRNGPPSSLLTDVKKTLAKINHNNSTALSIKKELQHIYTQYQMNSS